MRALTAKYAPHFAPFSNADREHGAESAERPRPPADLQKDALRYRNPGVDPANLTQCPADIRDAADEL